MNITDLLQKIGNYKTKNSLEKTGVFRDLETITQKFERGEYKKGFINANKFDIGTRTEGLFREMEFLLQLGHDWERILRVLPLSNFSKVVDLCPGYTPKIELGLYFRQYSGKVYVLDIDLKSMGSLARFIKLFDPKFEVIKKKENLFGKTASLYDLVLGNHVIDDLVVYYFTKKLGVKLKDFYASEDVAVGVWKNILADRTHNAEDVSGRIADIFVKITNVGGTVCLTQYESYAEKLFDLRKAYSFNKEVFGKVKSILVKRGFKDCSKSISKAFRGYKGHFGEKDCMLLQENG